MMHAEIVSGLKDFSRYEQIWRQLFQGYGNEPSTSYEWTNALLTTHVKKDDSIILAILKNQQEIVGLVPIIMSTQKKLGQKLVNLFPISEYHNIYSDILLAEPTGEAIQALIDAIFNMGLPWDILRMRRLIDSGPLVSSIEPILKGSSIDYVLGKREPSFGLTLEETYEDYLRNRSSKFRNFLKRAEKKIAHSGSMELRNQKCYESLDAAFEDLLRVERNSWKHHHGTAISAIRKQEIFYRQLCRETHKSGRLHLTFLILNNEPIAYNLGYIHREKYSYLKTSYDERFRALSPSTVLRAKLIDELIRDGMVYVEFSAELYEWERQWTKEVRWHRSLIISNKTLKGKFFYTYIKAREKVGDGRTKSELTYRNPRDLRPAKN